MQEVGGSIPPGSTSLRSLRELRLGKPAKSIVAKSERGLPRHNPNGDGGLRQHASFGGKAQRGIQPVTQRDEFILRRPGKPRRRRSTAAPSRLFPPKSIVVLRPVCAKASPGRLGNPNDGHLRLFSRFPQAALPP